MGYCRSFVDLIHRRRSRGREELNHSEAKFLNKMKQNSAISEDLRLNGSKSIQAVSFSADNDSYFESVLQILIRFSKFMSLYQALEEENIL